MALIAEPAVSWVLAGGVFAAVLGPQLIIFTKDVWPAYLFAGTYLAQSACAMLAAGVLAFLKIPKPARMRTCADGQPLLEVVRKPTFIVAVVCGLACFGVMNLMMTAARSRWSCATTQSMRPRWAFNGMCSACRRRVSSLAPASSGLDCAL